MIKDESAVETPFVDDEDESAVETASVDDEDDNSVEAGSVDDKEGLQDNNKLCASPGSVCGDGKYYYILIKGIVQN